MTSFLSSLADNTQSVVLLNSLLMSSSCCSLSPLHLCTLKMRMDHEDTRTCWVHRPTCTSPRTTSWMAVAGWRRHQRKAQNKVWDWVFYKQTMRVVDGRLPQYFNPICWRLFNTYNGFLIQLKGRYKWKGSNNNVKQIARFSLLPMDGGRPNIILIYLYLNFGHTRCLR